MKKGWRQSEFFVSTQLFWIFLAIKIVTYQKPQALVKKHDWINESFAESRSNKHFLGPTKYILKLKKKTYFAQKNVEPNSIVIWSPRSIFLKHISFILNARHPE